MATVKGRRGRGWVRGGLVVMAMFLALAFSHGQVVHAAGLSVTNCNATGAGSLADAVATANTNAGADTITIIATCTGASAVNPGATLVLSDTAGATTITRAGASAGFVVSGGNARTVFVVNTGVTATIRGVTISGGRGATGTNGTDGPNNYGSTPTAGGAGGAGGTGGVANSGTLTLADVTTSGNTGGTGGTGGAGGTGGIANGGTLALTNVTLSGNTGGPGGPGGASGPGGPGGPGFPGYNYLSGGPGLTGGTGGNGGPGGAGGNGGAGGIAVSGGTLTLANVTLSGNSGGNSSGGGSGGSGGAGGAGGLSCDACGGRTGNPGATGGSGARGGNGSNGTGGTGGVRRDGGGVSVGGTILAGNSGGDYAGAAVTDNGHNLVGTASGGATFGGTGTQTNVANPQLRPLGFYSGPTQTRPPQLGSPAINAGAASCNVTYTDPTTNMPVTLSTDQRGGPRPQGSACDIGAVEIIPGTRIVSVDDAGDGEADISRCLDATAGNCRLRDALAIDGGGTITFNATAFPSAGPPRTITLDPAQGQLTLSDNVTITGPGAGALTVARSTAMDTPQFRIFLVNSGVTATISGLTIAGGDVHFGGNDGGGILSYGTLTITDAAVTNNFSGNNGGGIQHNGTTLTVTNTTVSGNSAYNNGGGIGQSTGTSMLTNVTVSDNFASRGSGFGQIGGTSTLTNVTVTGNTALASQGGAIYNSGTLNATRTIVAGNTGGDFGLLGINGPTNTANLTAGDPMLAPLGNYGGPTQTRPPLPGSPALNAGGTGCMGTTDQRGVSRPQGSACDIGAVEIRGYTLTPTAGSTPQTTSIGTAFAQPLAVTLTETGGSPLPASGVSVMFAVTPGASGASATVTGSPALTDSTGVASVNVSANGIAGAYTATASAAGIASATFNLSNAAVVANISPSSGSVNGGSLVTITGAGFAPGNTTVRVGGTTVTPDSVTATAITFRTAPGEAGAADVIVTVSGIGTTKTGAYTYGVVNPIAAPQPSVPANGIPNPRPAPQPSAPGIGTPDPLPPSR